MRRTIASLALILAACGSSGGAADATSAPTTESPSTSTPVAATETTRATTSTTTTPVSTTTSAATEPPPPINDAEFVDDPGGTIGYVGCSMSQNAVRGYQLEGGDRMWRANAPYGGGSLGRWADAIGSERTRYWEGFGDFAAQHPDTQVIWFSICTIRGAPIDNADTAELIMDEIRVTIPDAIFYVSAQPVYTDGHVCDLASASGPEKMHDVAAELVARGVALPGPLMGPLTGAQTADGCHANDDGQRLMGRQLLGFFG